MASSENVGACCHCEFHFSRGQSGASIGGRSKAKWLSLKFDTLIAASASRDAPVVPPIQASDSGRTSCFIAPAGRRSTGPALADRAVRAKVSVPCGKLPILGRDSDNAGMTAQEARARAEIDRPQVCGIETANLHVASGVVIREFVSRSRPAAADYRRSISQHLCRSRPWLIPASARCSTTAKPLTGPPRRPANRPRSARLPGAAIQVALTRIFGGPACRRYCEV